ncbi:MAG: 50S ribosomal protein L32 [Nitrospirota bacterium]
MAHPKHKISRTRRDKRRSHKSLHVTSLAVCPQCKEPKLPHYVCMSCGTYNGREVIVKKES